MITEKTHEDDNQKEENIIREQDETDSPDQFQKFPRKSPTLKVSQLGDDGGEQIVPGQISSESEESEQDSYKSQDILSSEEVHAKNG